MCSTYLILSVALVSYFFEYDFIYVILKIKIKIFETKKLCMVARVACPKGVVTALTIFPVVG